MGMGMGMGMAGGAVLAAWCVDLAFGEPRDRWHPVAWMGAGLARIGRTLPRRGAGAAFALGTLAWMTTVAGVGALAWVLQRSIERHCPAALAWLALGIALKPALAWRMLRDEVGAVEEAFACGLDAARERVAGLCSRDARMLDATAVRETAIETLAENLNDSLVAPLFWFAVFGLPGAWVWRAVNTMDAMWGYRGRWEWAGKCAARADDLLAWLPARLTAMLLWRPGTRLAQLRREAARTPSPNGGWPMAAMALALGVRLSKPGVYDLNAAAARAGQGSVDEALRLAGRAAWLGAGVAAVVAAAMGRT